MFICDNHKSKRILWQGMSCVVGHFAAMDIKRKYGAEVKVTPAYPAIKKPRSKSGPCISIPVSEYLLGLQ